MKRIHFKNTPCWIVPVLTVGLMAGTTRATYGSVLDAGGNWTTEHVWTQGVLQIMDAIGAEAVLDDPSQFPPEDSITLKTPYIHFDDNAGPPLYVPLSNPYPLWDPVNGGPGRGDRNDFAIRCRGRIKVIQAGMCWIVCNSDDGFSLRVDGTELGSAGNRARANTVMSIDLTVGLHDVEFVHWERDGGAGVSVYISKEISATEPLVTADAYELLQPWLDTTDTDGDGMFDEYENDNGLNPAVNDAALDKDGDGLTNLTEFQRGTRADKADTDADGLNDSVETNTGTFVSATNTGTNPRDPDTDDDGLKDNVETNTGAYNGASDTGTNPFLADTDGDSFTDSVEVLFSNANPLNPASRPLRPAQLDLLAHWNFNDASNPAQTLDAIKGFPGTLVNAAAFTADAEGRTGLAGDRAIDLGAIGREGNKVRVAAAGFLNIAATQNQVAISFWQRLDAVVDSSSFWADAPSAGGSRGLNAHVPWSDNNFYWDTAGCCTPEANRISGPNPVDLVGAWHHLVFLKNGNDKEVWVDGVRAASGANTGPLNMDFTVLHIGSDAGNANIAGRIDDFAVFDSLTPENIAALAGGASPPSIIPPSTDADGDGMPDAYETANGLNPNVDDRLGDLDADGSNNFAEFLANTLPNNPDTDADGLKDGVETKTGTFVSATNTGTDPLKADTDGDSLPDGAETGTGVFVSATNTGTNPNNADTDGDTWNDGIEIDFGSNPFLATSVPTFELAWWPFNDTTRPLVSADVVNGIDATFLNGADFSADGMGRTGDPGDRALDLGTVKMSQMGKVLNAQWLNLAAADDSIAFSYWQNLVQVSNSSSFWASTPTEVRGAQGHSTWSDGNFYWDTAGCCTPDVHRISGPNSIDLVGTWHHFVFQKNGTDKQIYVDGVLTVIGTDSDVLPSDFNELTIGAEPAGQNNTLGLIDDFVVYGVALTEEQVMRLAAGESPDVHSRTRYHHRVHQHHV